MTKRPIIFRADGGPSIGMGHFIRTLALAEMLNEQFHCVFATRKPTEYQIAEIEKICHGRMDLPEDDSHFEQFLSNLKGHEIVVLDNYYFTTEYQKSIKARDCKLVCIDDLHDKHFVADVVINHAEGINPAVYSIEAYTNLLLGYKYALIRKEFRKATTEEINKKYACMIMMGGADPFGITYNLIDKLKHVKFEKPVAVVNGITEEKHQYLTKTGNFHFYQKLPAEGIANLMKNSEFGIFPASTVAIEACAMRLPFLCGYFIGNQKEIYNGIEKEQLAICVGDYNELSEYNFLKVVSDITSDSLVAVIRNNQKKVMDNKTENRYNEIFKNL